MKEKELLRATCEKADGCLLVNWPGCGECGEREEMSVQHAIAAYLAEWFTVPRLVNGENPLLTTAAREIESIVMRLNAETRCCDVCGKRIVDDFYAACDDCERAITEVDRG